MDSMNTQPKIYSISDIIEWDSKEQLKLSPKYQRNPVWNEKAKSYLIDTIVRGMTIPPIFMRQTIDSKTKITYREIVDGQQRLRAIIEYVNNKFSIHASHNKEFANKYYDDLSIEEQENILRYDIVAQVINESRDEVIYEMFARLNTNNYVLNKQEIRNAKFWGEFKVCAYEMSREHRPMLNDNGVFTDKQFSRMDDVEFISQLLNFCINGICDDSPSILDRLYSKYDESFNERQEIELQFNCVMEKISAVYEYLNGNSACFTKKTYLYTLFVYLYHQLFGANNCNFERLEKLSADKFDFSYLINRITRFEDIYNDCIKNENKDSQYFALMDEFAKYHKTRTTNKSERERRVEILSEMLKDGQ